MKTHFFLKKSLIAGLLFVSISVFPQKTSGDKQVSWLPGETREQKDARMAWWTQAKFGMFIHWGLYSIPAGDGWYMRNKKIAYSEYSKYAEQFNPLKFNADEWMALAHDAGIKYAILTTKHHEGFALFKSQASAYNIVDASPFKRDVVKELAEACPRHNVLFGTYYSFLADWGHTGGQAGCPYWDPKFQEGDKRAYIANVAIPQVKELLTNYGKICAMWFDTDGSREIKPEESAALVEVLKTQPQLIVDPRVGGVKGDFNTIEAHMPVIKPKDDYWELCTTINGSWGYTRTPAKPLEKLLPYLITAWGMGGNVLLNVGPNPDGVIPADSQERLRQIGQWFKVNGESIYGSNAGPFVWLPWGTATYKNKTLYLQIFHWPEDGLLSVPLANKPKKAWLLADRAKKALSMDRSGDRIVIHLPKKASDPVASVVAFQVEGEPVNTYTSLCLNKPVTASCSQKFANALTDDDDASCWKHPDSTANFIVEFGKNETFTTMRICPRDKVVNAKLEVRESGVWRTLLDNLTLVRDENLYTFPAATGDAVRFSFFGNKKAPDFHDFEIFPPF